MYLPVGLNKINKRLRIVGVPCEIRTINVNGVMVSSGKTVANYLLREGCVFSMHYFGTFLEGINNAMKIFGPNLNGKPSEYEAQAVNTTSL
jgi:hypothetical protein